MTKAYSAYLFIAFILLFSYSCKNEKELEKQDKKVIATVFDHDLFMHEIPVDFTNSPTGNDSAALVNAFVDQWIRKMLLLHEAEKRKPESLNINKLVEDYKQSLLINKLEKQVISEELDTIVSKKELNSMYERIKENFVQEYPIIRLSYYKIPEKASQIDKFYEWWNQDNIGKMEYYSKKWAEVVINDPNEWREYNEIKNIIDPKVLDRYSFKKVRSIQKNIGEYEYFIKIKEFVDKNDISPLTYIEDQIKNMIIQKRKTSVMEKYLERIYLKELKNNNIVIQNAVK